MKNDSAITVGGIAFAVFTFAGIFLLLPGVAGGNTTNAESAAWVADGAHRMRALLGAYVMCGGALAMVAFVAGMVGRLRAAGASSTLIEVARLSGIAFVICQLVAATAMAGAAYAVIAGNEPTPIDPGAARITTFGLALWLIPGMLSAALFACIVGISVLWTKTFPTWVGLAALLTAAVLLAAITFLPAMILLLWSAAVGLVAMVRRQREFPLEAPAAPP